MKVLYVGYYKEKSDWGRQATENILALDSAGVDVVCRSIEISETKTPTELLKFEQKDLQGCTHCIQHLFPDHLVGSDKFEKNVALVTNNFVSIENSSWREKLKLVDEVWLPSDKHVLHVRKQWGGVNLKPLPVVFNNERYTQKYSDISLGENQQDFKFYTSCSSDDMVGLSWVVSAFHAEFHPIEKVSLVIHVKDGNEKAAPKIEKLLQEIKGQLRLLPDVSEYKKDAILAASKITDQNMEVLHNHCDCYVSCSKDFTFPLLEVDAYGFGNTPIVSNKSSVTEYVGEEHAVDSIFQVTKNANAMFRDVNNGKDFWIRPCEKGLREMMREVFNSYQENQVMHKLNNKRQAITHLSAFSRENVGNKMKEMLNV